jgi:simple sugar transport system permease protein
MISGGLNSLCGFFAVIGTYYTCIQGFYRGIGWNALTAALICSVNAKLLIPACLILAYFFTATDCAMITNSISSGTPEIIQGILLLSTAIPYFKKEKL